MRFFHYQKRVREGGEWNHQGTRVFFIFFPDPGPFLVPDPRLFLFCTSHFSVLSVADSGCLFDNFLVADPDPGKSEGGDSREVRRVGGISGAIFSLS